MTHSLLLPLLLSSLVVQHRICVSNAISTAYSHKCRMSYTSRPASFSLSPELARSRRQFFSTVAVGASAVVVPRSCSADSGVTTSRTAGYKVQRTEREWSYVLSGTQFNILRNGGTERPFSSILESEKREGVFVCAGCGTPLFESGAKFNSGTGWPSFASALPGVEVEQINPIQMSRKRS